MRFHSATPWARTVGLYRHQTREASLQVAFAPRQPELAELGLVCPGMTPEAMQAHEALSPLVGLLRCLECGGGLQVQNVEPGAYPELGPEADLLCLRCGESYPIIGGTARMLRREARASVLSSYPRSKHGAKQEERERGDGGLPGNAERELKQRTADSFAYEWEQFGALRKEWRRNFLEYMHPHPPERFDGTLFLDVGTGSGRHSRQAAELGAQVVAVDLGRAIDVARSNLPPSALTVQADAEDLPFEQESFDLVASIGVLHHLPNPERAFRSIVRYAKPGGWVQIYLYWQGAQPWHRLLLRIVTQVRKITVGISHRLLHVLCYPLAALLFAAFVLPNRAMRHVPVLRSLAARLPLQSYADYPLGVCVNDQFDRFSAPIENRYTAQEVERWLVDGGLVETRVLPSHGWVGSGRRPHP